MQFPHFIHNFILNRCVWIGGGMLTFSGWWILLIYFHVFLNVCDALLANVVSSYKELYLLCSHPTVVNCGNSTLAAFGWTAQKPDDPSSLRSYVGLFDLNQWYHSQMPLKVFWKKKGPGARIPLLGCEFFAFFSLVDNHGCIRGNRAQTILVSRGLLQYRC